MKKILVCLWTFFMMLTFVPALILAGAELGVSYQAHVQNVGWQSVVADGATAGTTGQSLRLEAIEIRLVNAATLRIGDYFPIRENIHSVYQGQENEFASYDVFIDYTTTTADHLTEQWLDYYVKDLGLVKSVFINTADGTEISSSLSSIEEGAVMTQNISFFYPNINDGKIYYQIRTVGFHTNDITRVILATAYKENAPFTVFSPNTKINSLYLNQDGMVYLDLSGDYLTEMNAGAELEAMMLQSIANTFGKYYGVDRVLLTIDNQLYQSGHIALGQGEYLSVNLDGTVSLN